MGFVGDMLSWEQSGKQREIAKELAAQSEQNAFIAQQLHYQSVQSYNQTLIMLDILAELQALNHKLDRPLSVVMT